MERCIVKISERRHAESRGAVEEVLNEATCNMFPFPFLRPLYSLYTKKKK